LKPSPTSVQKAGLGFRALLRIGLDGRAFTSPAGGVRRYVRELARALLALGEPIHIVALGGNTESGLPPGVEHVAEPVHPPTNLGWALIGLPRAARRARVDVIHAPAYTGPLLASAPVVLTVHDVSYARHPEWYPYRRDRLRRAFYRRSARAAAIILTDSDFSAHEICAAYGISRERIVVVPLGVDAMFSPAGPMDRCELPQEITTPFLLHVGDLHERRNLGMLVDAVLAARRHFGGAPSVSLVLAGVDRGVGDGLCALAAQADDPNAVVKLGVVSDDLLLALYRCAIALVYPSLYEGFGLPLLEAMACGTPVIASRAASIPEVIADAGILLDPHDVDAWTSTIVNVVNDGDRRAALRTRGLARASEFGWNRTARLTLEVYHRAKSDVGA
jgi:glycosyltransferase involved in cell wall biosynthesis